MPHKIKETYDKRLVAFIDILGFKNLIDKTEAKGTEDSNKQALETIKKLQQVIYSFQNRIRSAINKNELPDGTIASMFSDTIVVSIPKQESIGIIALFKIIKYTQVELISKNILLRGGIVFGELIHNESLIIGPALINAYEVESKSAVYPRIVIDPKVLYLYARRNGIPINNARISEKDLSSTLKKDFDGTYYIDYFNDLVDLTRPQVKEYIMSISTMVKGVSKLRNNTSLRMKYLWMGEKLKRSDYFHLIKERR